MEFQFKTLSGQARCDRQRREKPPNPSTSVTLSLKPFNPAIGIPGDGGKGWKPVIPKWPTRSGKTQVVVRRYCTGKITGRKIKNKK